MEHPDLTEQDDPDTRTFTLGQLCPKSSEQCFDVGPTD
jgi:hypothetical protein